MGGLLAYDRKASFASAVVLHNDGPPTRCLEPASAVCLAVVASVVAIAVVEGVVRTPDAKGRTAWKCHISCHAFVTFPALECFMLTWHISFDQHKGTFCRTLEGPRSDYGSEGWEFESLRARKNTAGQGHL